MTVMLQIQKLRKEFGPILAVDNVSFDVAKGEVLGFLGPNGAGKSTTMKMVTGFLAPTSGTAIVSGFDVQDKPLETKSRIGYLPEGAPLYGDMTPEGLFKFVAEVRGIPKAKRRSAIDDAASRVQLEGVMRQPIETLSKGYKRRVGLAQAILHDPELLILDEPTDGLDPNQKHEVRELIKEMSGHKAIVLSTHILEEVGAVCSRAMVIARGRIVADGTPAELEARSRHYNAVRVTVRASAEKVAAELGQLPIVASVESLPSANGFAECRVFPKTGKSIVADVSQRLRDLNWDVDGLTVEPGRLDDVYRSLTQPSSDGGEA